MHRLVGCRRLLARRPWLYWLAISGLAAIAWLTVRSAVAAADARQAAWGTTVAVWVAAEPIAAGDPMVVETRDYPVAVVPADAVRDRPDGPAARTVGMGDIITAADTTDPADPPGAIPAPDAVVLAVPAAGAPQLAPGAAVLLLGNGTPLCDGVTTSAPTAEWVEVAVAPECAAALTGHLAAGTVVVARRT